MNNQKIDDKTKAAIFTHDARVFLRSISDALVCTKQIASINCNKEMYLERIAILDQTLKHKTLLLAKYCEHDICNVNIIASSSFNSYYTYFLLKFSVNLFLNYYERLKNIKDFYALGKEFDLIYYTLNMDLKNYVDQTKRKHFILTKDEKGQQIEPVL